LTEIKSLKEALSSRQKEWFKEKLDYQERIAGIYSNVRNFRFHIL
jgi:hypothetical protein